MIFAEILEIDIPYSWNSPGLNFYSIVERFEPVCSGDQTSLSDDHNSYVRVVENGINKAKLQLFIKDGKKTPKISSFDHFLTFFTPPDVF